MFNFILIYLKHKLTTGWTQKWYYWGYLNFIIGISFILFCYTCWLLYPTSLFNASIYIIFFWLGLILTPIYWCWLWIIFILYIWGIKVPFFLYPLGMGLVACRLGILILYGFIIFIPIKYLIFKIHQYLYNLFLDFLLTIVSVYKKVQKQTKTLITYKKYWLNFKKWIRQLSIFYILKFQDDFPKYYIKQYIKVYNFVHKYYILIIIWYFIVRIFYFLKLKFLIFLYKKNLYKFSTKYYLKFILNNILVIQKTQIYNPDVELVIMRKKFLKTFKQLKIKPRLLISNDGYYLRMKQQKLYNKLYSNENINKQTNK